MTPLRNRMECEMRLRNLSENTRRAYLQHVAAFARYFGQSPALLGTEEVRGWLLRLEERGCSPATRALHHAALRFFYTATLGRPEVMAGVPRPRLGHRPLGLPLVQSEARRLLEAARAPSRLHAMVATLLGTGLRVSEACALQVRDLDARANLLHVRHGKGDKARAVRLSDDLLAILRRYWKAERLSGSWLFPCHRFVRPGQIDPVRPWADRPLHRDLVERSFRTLSLEAGLGRRVRPHDLRRTYGTWLLEAGVDLRTVQALLGHASPTTTARYTAVRPDLIRRTPTPLDLL